MYRVLGLMMLLSDRLWNHLFVGYEERWILGAAEPAAIARAQGLLTRPDFWLRALSKRDNT